MTKVVVTSDFHGHLPPPVPECDLLLLAGDCLPASTSGSKLYTFDRWLRNQPAAHIVGISGNHDLWAEESPAQARALSWTYLLDETVELCGLKIFGSPWSMPFNNWAYMKPDHELGRTWEAIPDDIDVLVVHGPAHGVRDKTRAGNRTGSLTLRERLVELHKLRLFAFGHIHKNYGVTHLPRLADVGADIEWLTCVNGSCMDESYRLVNPPVVVEL